MADYNDYMAEMQMHEKSNTQERLKLAKKRRQQQLKRWNQHEQELSKKGGTTHETCESSSAKMNGSRGRSRIDNVHFEPSVVFFEAASRNDTEEVRKLLEQKVNPDSTNKDGLTPLHQCSIDGSEEMMNLLIDYGANVNAKDSDQWTPLHAGAMYGNLPLVKCLISRGADLLAVNADGNMPYELCEHDPTLDYIEQQMKSRGITQQEVEETRAQTEMEMLQFLREQLDAGVPLTSIKFDSDASALHVAAANGYLDVVELLLEHAFPTDVVDADLWQPVHAAACWGHPEVLETLVQAGADLGATTKNGETPLDICEDPDLRELIEKLKSDMEARRLLQQQQMQLQQQQQLLQQNNANANQGRLKRSHSQNTRSQSVRRTSIREKSQISRREAREEAKLRRNSDEEIQKQVQQESQSETNGDTSTIKSTMTSGSNVNSSGGGLESGNETSPATKADDVEPLADLSIGQDQTDRPSVFNSQPESIINGNSHINNNVHNDLEQNSQAPLTGSKLTAARNGSILESSPAVNAALFGSPFASLDGQMGIVNERPIDCNGIEPVIVDDLKLARQLARNELPVGTYSNSNGAGYSGMGTLADLKKQRADLRNRFAFDAPTVEQMQTMRSIQNNHLNGNGLLLNGSLDSNANQNAAISNGRFTLNSKTHPPSLGSTGINGGSNLTDRSRVTSGTGVSFLHPPSPSCTLKKFCGDPTDVVGEMNQKGCCLLM